MDANGTRYHLLLGRSDWGRCLQDERTLAEAWDAPDEAPPDFAWDAARAELTLRPRLFQFIAAPLDVPPSLSDRRGAARDRYGSFYWVEKDGRTMKVRSVGTKKTSLFWPVAPPAARAKPGAFGPAVPPTPPPPIPLGGMAATPHHYLVVGTYAPAGLLVFDLHAGGAPLQLVWPEDVPFAPFDLSADAQGGLWVLDRENRRLWRLDARFHVVRASAASTPGGEAQDFQPVDPLLPRRKVAESFPEGTLLDASSPLEGLDPISVEVLPDGRVLVLDRGVEESRVLLLRDGKPQGEPVPLTLGALLEPSDPSSEFRLLAQDMAFVPEEDGTLGRIVVASSEGNQAFAFRLHEEGGQLVASPLVDYLPMRLFGGKAVISGGGQAFYDYTDGFVPLVAQRRPRYLPEGRLLTPVLDGRTPDCVWHRLFLDASIPAGASVRVRTRAANSLEELEVAPFTSEPEPHRRPEGSELPFAPRPPGDCRGTFELLFQRARGRYAQLELTLAGEGGSTPRLHALRVWYPRFSYVEQYLPGLYRQDRDAASFLERFLANTEGFFTTLEDRIAAAQVLFDARSAPAETLDWLASWFGVALDPAWDESRRRLFIRHALEFFQWRGTARGLRMALRLALDACPDESLFTEDEDPMRSTVRIVEKYRSARAGLLPLSAAAHQFSVVLPVPRGGTAEDQRARLEQALRVVELEKPAHTVFDVKFYWAMFRLGEARLGVDTLVDLGGRAPELLAAMELGRGHLAEGYLVPRPPMSASDRRVLGRDPLVGRVKQGSDIQ